MFKRNTKTSKPNVETVTIPKWRKETKAIEKFRFIHHFLPHPEKKERAKFLSFKLFGIYIIFVLTLITTLKVVPIFLPGVLGYASNINVRDLLSSTNNMRKQNNLDDLVMNKALSKAAYYKAIDMFKNDYWAHVSPSGTEPWDFILAQNYDYIYAGENLAKNFTTSSSVVKAWMESPSHRENLLNRNYKEVGFAVVNGTLNGYETTLVVQMFGQPRDLSTVASKEQSEKVLNQISEQAVSTVAPSPSVNAPVKTQNAEKALSSKDTSALDLGTSLRYFGILLLGFIAGLFVLDVWYSTRHGIDKLTGHTTAHLILIVMVILSIWVALKPGIIL